MGSVLPHSLALARALPAGRRRALLRDVVWSHIEDLNALHLSLRTRRPDREASIARARDILRAASWEPEVFARYAWESARREVVDPEEAFGPAALLTALGSSTVAVRRWLAGLPERSVARWPTSGCRHRGALGDGQSRAAGRCGGCPTDSPGSEVDPAPERGCSHGQPGRQRRSGAMHGLPEREQETIVADRDVQSDHSGVFLEWQVNDPGDRLPRGNGRPPQHLPLQRLAGGHQGVRSSPVTGGLPAVDDDRPIGATGERVDRFAVTGGERRGPERDIQQEERRLGGLGVLLLRLGARPGQVQRQQQPFGISARIQPPRRDAGVGRRTQIECVTAVGSNVSAWSVAFRTSTRSPTISSRWPANAVATRMPFLCAATTAAPAAQPAGGSTGCSRTTGRGMAQAAARIGAARRHTNRATGGIGLLPGGVPSAFMGITQQLRASLGPRQLPSVGAAVLPVHARVCRRDHARANAPSRWRRRPPRPGSRKRPRCPTRRAARGRFVPTGG